MTSDRVLLRMKPLVFVRAIRRRLGCCLCGGQAWLWIDGYPYCEECERAIRVAAREGLPITKETRAFLKRRGLKA